MRRNIVAGNWKMNLSFELADDLVNDIAEKLDSVELNADVVICPPFPYLELTSDLAQESNFFAGAQNVASFDNGAYTIAQNEESCVVFGMPMKAIQAGAVKDIIHLDEIADYIIEFSKGRKR